MISNILYILLIVSIIGAAAYFLIKEITDKPNNNGTSGNIEDNTEDRNDTSGQGGSPGN
jgi:hypothetical protein